MLHIRVNMNSTVEDVFNFKTGCCLRLFDQNLEILLENSRPQPIVISSYFDLEINNGDIRHIDTLMPAGNMEIPPGDIKAFYCRMDECLWKQAKAITFYDDRGNIYPVAVNDEHEKKRFSPPLNEEIRS